MQRQSHFFGSDIRFSGMKRNNQPPGQYTRRSGEGTFPALERLNVEAMQETDTMIEPALDQPTSPAPHAMSDDVLITLFQGGDREVFRMLVDRYRERIRNLIYAVLSDASVIDDLAQETFIKAYEALPQFRFDAAFYTWLYRIAVNRCRDEIRRRRVRRVFSLHPLLERQDRELTERTMAHPEDTETRELIDRALSRLPEKFRVPVVLKDVEGLSYDEIAEVTQAEIGTVKSRLFRGRAMLRNWLVGVRE
jgi:RNA polymerase sigma-70 factor, ECF subfamily